MNKYFKIKKIVKVIYLYKTERVSIILTLLVIVVILLELEIHEFHVGKWWEQVGT